MFGSKELTTKKVKLWKSIKLVSREDYNDASKLKLSASNLQMNIEFNQNIEKI